MTPIAEVEHPILCGYDGDGELYVEVCDDAADEATAHKAATELGGSWKVIGTEWLHFKYGEWQRCDHGDEGALKFWYPEWPEGPSYPRD